MVRQTGRSVAFQGTGGVGTVVAMVLLGTMMWSITFGWKAELNRVVRLHHGRLLYWTGAEGVRHIDGDVSGYSRTGHEIHRILGESAQTQEVVEALPTSGYVAKVICREKILTPLVRWRETKRQ